MHTDVHVNLTLGGATLSITYFAISSGIIKEGGVRVNIIPEKATLQLAVRAPLDKDVALLKQKVVACFNAAATATGCQVYTQK